MIKINKIYVIDFNDLFILILYYLRSRQHTTAPFSDNRRAMLAMSPCIRLTTPLTGYKHRHHSVSLIQIFGRLMR